jgi:hypothetical protein
MYHQRAPMAVDFSRRFIDMNFFGAWIFRRGSSRISTDMVSIPVFAMLDS